MQITHAITGLPLGGNTGTLAEKRYFSIFPIGGRLPKYYQAIIKAEEIAFKLASETGTPYDAQVSDQLIRWILYVKNETDKGNPVAMFFRNKDEYDDLVSKGIWDRPYCQIPPPERHD
jgi:hypothetical protein